MARDAGMKIEKIYIYPVKSLRGVELDSATLTKHGIPNDRTFMLIKLVDDKETGGKKNELMAVANYNELVRFFPSINKPKDGDESHATMTITHHPVNGGQATYIDIPLQPDTSGLEEVDVVMHLSPTKAYKMPARYNEWFVSCLGYECILVYIKDNLREVLMSSTKYKDAIEDAKGESSGWLSSISSITTKATQLFGSSSPEEVSAVRFSDVAPYLFVSSRSLDDCVRRLPEGETYDITKFRPNVIISGAKQPWEEDYWGELTIGDGTKIEAEHNCGRCRSINIDYDTGAQGKGEAGKMLKKLASDRRVDQGTKWSPIFGRYCFLHNDSEGDEIKVGQEVKVTRLNQERTAFDWKGLSTLPGGGRDS